MPYYGLKQEVKLEFVFEDKSSQGFSQPAGNTAEPLQMSSNTNLFGSSMTNPIGQSPTRRSRRSLPETVDDIGMTGTRRNRSPKKTSSQKVKYVKAPSKRKSKTGAKFVWTWQKFWWMVALITFTRLLFMENGVIDYYSLENTIKENQSKLSRVREENSEIVAEIHKIQTSPKHQRQVARDHLGVISANEYLVLFSEDSN
jgi:cell division protein FtsB